MVNIVLKYFFLSLSFIGTINLNSCSLLSCWASARKMFRANITTQLLVTSSVTLFIIKLWQINQNTCLNLPINSFLIRTRSVKFTVDIITQLINAKMAT